MSVKGKFKTGGSKVVQTFMAGVLAVGLMPLPAFAADLTAGSQDLSAQEGAKDSTGYITAAAYAAAEPAPEILGLNNFNFRSQSNTNEVTEIGKIFGDEDINEAVNPFVYNQINNLGNGVLYDGRGSGGPTSALAEYDTAANSTAKQNDVWNAKPNIVLGTGDDSYPDKATEEQWDYYYGEKYSHQVDKKDNVSEGTYHPIAVTYNRVSLPTMVGTMHRLAEAVEKVQAQEANKGLKTRYQDTATAKEIAKDYERYVVGSKGAVKWAIDNGKVKQKTVTCVNGYDADANTYRIITSGFSEGTASTNRYLETIAGVADDYYDVAPNKGTYTTTSTGRNGTTTTNNCAFVTADELRNSVDVIVVGAAAGTTDDSSVTKQLGADGLLVKTFYCSDWGNGSVFGTTVNSVENAQNVGRILPCVYPEVLDQSDMIAYYYDMFYHVKDNKLAETIDKNMDGVRNWNNSDSAALTSWAASDVSDYKQADVESLLKSGVAYLNSQASSLASNPSKDYLIPTANLAEDGTTPGTINVKKTQTITASDITKTEGDAAFSLNAKTDGDGKLSYISNDEKVVTVDANGTATIKGVGTTQVVITASATNEYASANKVILVTVKAKAADTTTKTPSTSTTTTPTTTTTTTTDTSSAEGTGLAKGAEATTGSGASAATVKATSSTAVQYVAPKSTSAKTVKVPDTVTVNGKKYKVTSIAANAFKGSKATKITVGKNVTTIGKKAFSGATKLKTLTLGKSVKTVKANALKGASKLTKLTLKSSNLTKASMKNLLKGSKVKTIKTSGVSSKMKKSYKKWAKAYGVTVK